jgi:hypothetical protein
MRAIGGGFIIHPVLYDPSADACTFQVAVCFLCCHRKHYILIRRLAELRAAIILPCLLYADIVGV